MNSINRVAVIADSACDISPQMAADLDVTVVPLNVTFPDGSSYQDGVTLTPADFYQIMQRTGTIPTTSQPSPRQFMNAFEKMLAEGRDVVCLTISSQLSGTYQSACIARETFTPGEQQHIHVFDTMNLCVGELLLVRMAASMSAQGISAKIIVETLTHLQPRVRVVAMFSTLENMRKGGRIPNGIAMAGKMLNIRPVLTVEKGKLALVGIAKGSRKGKNLIEKTIKKTGGVSYDRPIQFGYTGLDDELLFTYLKENEELYGGYSDNLPIVQVGSTIGTHAGPGAIACAFFSRK